MQYRGYIGIDPGQNGGIAVIDNTVTVYKMPKQEIEMFNILSQYKDYICYIETVHSMPRQGVASTFKFGYNYGIIHMAAVAAKLEVINILPQVWQKLYIKTKSKDKKEHKNRLKSIAQELFPNVKVTLWNADALLIANYAKWKLT